MKLNKHDAKVIGDALELYIDMSLNMFADYAQHKSGGDIEDNYEELAQMNTAFKLYMWMKKVSQ